MSAASLTEQKLLGLFELDPAGIVLYSRAEPAGDDDGAASPDIAGRNFYEEVAPFDNVEEFRQRVTEFALGASPADSFRFDCQYREDVLPVRVLLARIREQASNERTKSVIVHIRKDADAARPAKPVSPLN
jgi:hypothetical protein